MEHRISATELARTLGDVLARVRYRNDQFVVERNGAPIARVVPHERSPTTSLAEAFGAWRAAADPDPGLADDLELVGNLDEPPADPWAS